MRLQLLTVALILLNIGSACAARLVIAINEQAQEMTVTVDGEPHYVWPVSTGTARYSTPGGTYTPFRMEEFHFSREWDDAPMPHSIFFTRVGHAIHGTEHVDSLGRRASHGCVRLDPMNAATLFGLVQEVGMPNTKIIVRSTAKKVKSPAVAQRKPPKKVDKAIVAVGPAEDEDEMTGVALEAAGKAMNKKPQLWPYERRN